MAKKSNNSSNVILNWILLVCIFILIVFVLKYLFGIKKIIRKDNNTEEQFSNMPKMTIIYAYSKTCPFCLQFEGTFDNVTKKFVESNDTHNIDVQKIERSNLTEKYMQFIDGFPTVLVFQGDNFIKKAVGKMPEESFMKFLKSVM